MSRHLRFKNYEGIIEQVRKGNIILTILQDDDPISPRTWNNLGTMVCFHKKYILGDEYKYRNYRDFLESLAREVSYHDNGQALRRVLEDKAKCIYELDYDEERKKWLVCENGDIVEEYNDEKEAEKHLEALKQEFYDDCINYRLDELDDEDLMYIICQNAVILPLYLYDHSGLAMSTSNVCYPFNDPWDAGQVGWIYVTYEKVKKEFGKLDDETIRRAKEILEKEVETYNLYLSGAVYGFMLDQIVAINSEECRNCDEDTEECFTCDNLEELVHVDSCFGFYAETRRELKEQMKSCVAPEYRSIFDEI